MKNYRIYILALLLVLASQSLLAIDGWWEKLEMKNQPTFNKNDLTLNIADGKIIKFSVIDTNTSKTDLTPKPVTDVWYLNFEMKEWSHLQFDFPKGLWEDYNKLRPENIFTKFSDNKLLAFFRESAFLEYDSSTWIIDIEKQTWTKLDKTGGVKTDKGYIIGQIKDSIAFLYEIGFSNPAAYTYIQSKGQILEKSRSKRRFKLF